MTLYQQDSGPAYGRYGALPSVCDSTALDEITLYGDLLQVVAEHPSADKRLDWTVIDQALGVTPLSVSCNAQLNAQMNAQVNAPTSGMGAQNAAESAQ